MSGMRYIWSLPLGRLALAGVVMGIIGLTAHYWAPLLLVVAIPRVKL